MLANKDNYLVIMQSYSREERAQLWITVTSHPQGVEFFRK